jgi:hypothetical protein
MDNNVSMIGNQRLETWKEQEERFKDWEKTELRILSERIEQLDNIRHLKLSKLESELRDIHNKEIIKFNKEFYIKRDKKRFELMKIERENKKKLEEWIERELKREKDEGNNIQ